MSEASTADQRPTVTKADIIEGLRAVGVRPGDALQVHSSLSALGYVVGGADAVVDALLEAVGPEGTVMVPTFNHSSVDIFDAWHSPSINGAITEALRLRPEAVRSRHPTHPYAAIGRLAEYLTSGPALGLTFNPYGPLGRLAKVGGKILLLGVGMRANTAAHVGETIAGAHCLGYMEGTYPVLMDDGEVRNARCVAWRNGPCLIEWDALEGEMRRRGMIADGRVGAGEVHLMKAADVIDVTIELAAKFCPKCPTGKRPPRSRPGYALGDWVGGRSRAVSKC